MHLPVKIIYALNRFHCFNLIENFKCILYIRVLLKTSFTLFIIFEKFNQINPVGFLYLVGYVSIVRTGNGWM